jgi:hypothetical protein
MNETLEIRWVEMVEGIPTIRYNKVENQSDLTRQFDILKSNEAVEEIVLYSQLTIYKKGE